MSAPLELYGADYSVYVRICRIVLAEKAAEYTLHPIDIFADGGVPSEYLGLNPLGRIPSLRHGSFALYETDAIASYVDEAFEGPALMPIDAKARARARQIMRLADTEIYKHLVWGVYVPAQDDKPLAGLQRADLILGELDRLSGKKFMAGDAFSLADAYVYPMLRYFSLVPEAAARLAELPKLVRWMEETSARQSVIASQFPAERNNSASK